LETFLVIFLDLVDSNTESSDKEDWSFLNKTILVLGFSLFASEEEADWTFSDDEDSDSSWSFSNKTILAVGFLLFASEEEEDCAVSDDDDSDTSWSFLNKTIFTVGFLLFASEEEEDWPVSDDVVSDSFSEDLASGLVTFFDLTDSIDVDSSDEEDWFFENKTILAVGFLLFASEEEEDWTVSEDDDSDSSWSFLNKTILAVGFLLFASEEEKDWAISDDDDSDSFAEDLASGLVLFFFDLADPIDTDSSDEEDCSFFNKTIFVVGFLLFASEEEEDWGVSDDDDLDSTAEDLDLVIFFFDLTDSADTDSLGDVDGDFLNKTILVLVFELLDTEEGEEDWELSVDDVSDSSVEDLSSSLLIFFLDLTDPTMILTVFLIWLLKR